MKFLGVILAVLMLVAVGNAQTPISTFPYFYNWTGASAFATSDGRTYAGGDGHWGTYSASGTAQFAVNVLSAWVETGIRNSVDTLFAVVDARGRTFSGGEVFTFGASRTGNTSGTLNVYANSTLILSKDVGSDLTNGSFRSFSAPLPADVGNSIFTVYLVVSSNKDVYIDNTGISVGPLPITLASFTLVSAAGSVQLTWTTLSEIDNYGFYVQKSDDMESWADVSNSFQPGYGTTVDTHSYSFTDNTLPSCKYYRLRQVDLDGTNHFSDALADAATAVDPAPRAKEFALKQSYPNPFNPSTIISFSLARQGHTTLTIYNTLGEEVATLVNEVVTPGEHSVVWNPSNLSSGTYFYVLKSDNRVQVKKTILLK